MPNAAFHRRSQEHQPEIPSCAARRCKNYACPCGNTKQRGYRAASTRAFAGTVTVTPARAWCSLNSLLQALKQRKMSGKALEVLTRRTVFCCLVRRCFTSDLGKCCGFVQPHFGSPALVWKSVRVGPDLRARVPATHSEWSTTIVCRARSPERAMTFQDLRQQRLCPRECALSETIDSNASGERAVVRRYVHSSRVHKADVPIHVKNRKPPPSISCGLVTVDSVNDILLLVTINPWYVCCGFSVCLIRVQLFRELLT